MDNIQSVAEAVRELGETVQITNQGLVAMCNSLAIQTEMLSKILAAVTEPALDESPLTEFLERIADGTDNANTLLMQIAAGVQRVEAAVARR